MMQQLDLFWDNPHRVDWRNFRHEEDWAGWTIVVKLIADPMVDNYPYEWTLVRNRGRERLADPTLHQTLTEAIEHAKSAIVNYKEGYIDQ